MRRSSLAEVLDTAHRLPLPPIRRLEAPGTRPGRDVEPPCFSILPGLGTIWDNQGVVQRLYRRVELTQGKYAWVDPDEYERVMAAGPWYAGKSRSTWYAYRKVTIGGRQTTQGLPSFLTGFKLVDHRDGDGLNNRRGNLRRATDAQNKHNQGLARHNTSGLKGVRWDKRCKCWRAEIRVDGKQKTIGRFPGPPPPARAPREAGRAYDKAALEYFGEFARTNVMLGLL